MPDSVTALTALAVSAFRDRNNSKQNEFARWLESSFIGDPVFQDAQVVALVIASQDAMVGGAVKEVFAEPDLVDLGHKDGELDPMYLTPGGGGRMAPELVISGLLTSAFLRIHYLRLPFDEGTFARSVLEGFGELRRAARGEPIRAHKIFGITGVTLPEGMQVSTPWGVMRPALLPAARHELHMWQHPTTCLLAEPRLLPVKIDRAAQPQADFESAQLSEERSRILFPLSCALASDNASDPNVPLITWSTLVLPFQSGFSFSRPIVAPPLKPPVDIGSRIAEIEEWARIIEGSHTPSVDVAARRLVSAASQRLDRSDALIDAVMVWENLVGTTQETTFRVTAALAKALEPDRAKRRSLRNALKHTYDIRSRVVHGAAVEQGVVNDAASNAIDIAIRALRLSYKKGRQWLELSSTERADSLLLEEA